MKSLYFLKLVVILSIVLIKSSSCAGSDIGTLNCNNGTWAPDAKLIGFGIQCPLPLDGKASSKGKTLACALKKGKVYDGTTVKKAEIAPLFCGAFPQSKIQKECKSKLAGCLKNSDGYFKDPKTDKEYKTWSPLYECVEKWLKTACKK